jgi:ribose 5-phosphate isomerase RpiB
VEHDDANVLSLGARVIGEAGGGARPIVGRFSGERHVRRLKKIEALERGDSN